jgi:hypothetical protein
MAVKTLLTITDDPCRDLDNPAMWLKIKELLISVVGKKQQKLFQQHQYQQLFR